MNRRAQFLAGVSLLLIGATVTAAEVPDFNQQVLPIFRKYCNGCHNAKEAEGGLVLEDFARSIKGGDSGPEIVPGKSADSRIWQLLTSRGEDRMPPRDQVAPKPAELAILKAWIDGGAKAPAGGHAAATGLITPKIAVQGPVRDPVVSIAVSPNGRWIARAKTHSIEVLDADQKRVQTLSGHSGQINDVSFSSDSAWVCVAAGESGLSGEATLWNTTDWTRGPVIRGHRDSIYAARIAPGSKVLATASYDRNVMLWDVATAKAMTTIEGHNDAVYGLSFSPDGRWLATASGDRTVKLWETATGHRLDTFSQPAKDQYTVAVSPDGKRVAAGGVDFRLRIWGISDSAREGTNPILYARFAHEGPILKVVFSPDGRLLATSSEDRLIKLWETRTFTQVAVLPRQPDWTAALSFSQDNRMLFVGRMNGDVSEYPIDPSWGEAASPLPRLSEVPAFDDELKTGSLTSITETEPNDEPGQATPLALPGMASGKFLKSGSQGDVDLYRIKSMAGQNWIVETNAARSGSTADTKIEVLHADGRPVVHAILQAVRDSWINFRPIDSSSSDVRLEFWEEMDLNQFLYMNGEICKTFRAPQGPDSGFQLYALNGKRRNYFDTSATAHAKDEPCYIVEAYPAGSKIVENGLPIFPLYFSNDDDANRRFDKDSRLTFTAPGDGEYLIKVTDVRGFAGDKATYSLSVRTPQPDFAVAISTLNPKVPAASGQRLKFTLNRIDDFEGDVRLDITGLPAGFSASSPVVIAAGHAETTSVLSATADAAEPTPADCERTTVLATGRIGGRLATRIVGTLGQIKLDKAPQIRVSLVPDEQRFVVNDQLVILPGTTITAKIVVDRHGFDGDVKFDVDNLPHGVIVDNIGLSGVLVRAKETERQIFLTARPWTPATERLIHAVSQVQGNQASRPLSLRVGTIDAVVKQ